MPTAANAKKTTITLRLDPALQARIDRLRRRYPHIDEWDVALRALLREGLAVVEPRADSWCATYGEPAPEAPEVSPALPLAAGRVLDFDACRKKLELLRARGL